MLPEVKGVSIGEVCFGGNAPLALIAGPCVIESEAQALCHAERIAAVARRLEIPYVFKASYDKANRSSLASYRGPGLEEGLRILERVKDACGLPVLSDIHSVSEVAAAADVLDCLQIPAFLCRQTDLLCAAAESGKPVNVKKGQFLAPWDAKPLVAKIRGCAGAAGCLVTERGVSFGYNTLVCDMRSLPLLRETTGAPVIFDATHAVQSPGGQGDSSGGDRRFVPYLARAAAAVGVDGLFLEAHENPDAAPCDGPNMVRLDKLEALLRPVIEIDRLVRG